MSRQRQKGPLSGLDFAGLAAGQVLVGIRAQALGAERRAASGTIAVLGPGTTLKQGDRVALVRHADDEVRESFAGPEAGLVPLPPGISFEVGALAAAMLAVPYRALLSRGGLKPTENVGVFACGGSGLYAVTLAAAHVVGIDARSAALGRARRLGADLVLDPGRIDAWRAVRAHTAGRGLDLALVMAEGAEWLELAQACLAPGGRVVLAEASGSAALAAGDLVAGEQAVLGTGEPTSADLEAVLALIASGRLDIGGLMPPRFALADIAAARAAVCDDTPCVLLRP
ncbi:MAG TPA: zinc-binding dehydrogenase [Alphaproteobacteria bacterium]|nr:zinc-binding dehydrogenase [Alphaproteobacteria bacterium]MDP6270525.1 zinc-binding dehydrogenase [Alphaproteobacteria bacterium]HJM50813.1 zinc-binding dehydrogenase [Alphaproteobacteria bacterium]